MTSSKLLCSAIFPVGRLAHRLVFSPQQAEEFGILVMNDEGVGVVVIHVFPSVVAIMKLMSYV